MIPAGGRNLTINGVTNSHLWLTSQQPDMTKRTYSCKSSIHFSVCATLKGRKEFTHFGENSFFFFIYKTLLEGLLFREPDRESKIVSLLKMEQTYGCLPHMLIVKKGARAILCLQVK